MVGAIAFALFEPIQVLPRLRPAPGYALTDGSGRPFTSEDARGTVVLYSYAPLACGDDCAEVHTTMAEVAGRVEAIDLAGAELRLVTIVLDDSPDPVAVAAAARAAGADGDRWRWIAGSETTVRNVVGTGFRRAYRVESGAVDPADPAGPVIEFDPGFVLVDGDGIVRGDYRYRTLADDADKLVDHIAILGAELRYANGAGAVAYEAAHLFLCYP